MSSSEPKTRMSALPWALDEFASTDIFPRSDALGAEPANASRAGDSSTPNSERARIEANAYARGIADGERIARDDVEPRVASLLAALAQAVESIRMHEARWLANADENVAAIAVSVARHILQREVATDMSTVNALVQRALAVFPLGQTITVRLSPEDHACGIDLLKGLADGKQDVRWIADPHITRGGCLVEGRERIIDGRVDTALERLYRSIGQVQA